VPILEDVHVHEKRFAGTSRPPEGKLSEVVGCIWLDPNILRQAISPACRASLGAGRSIKEELQALVKARYAILVEFLEGRVPHMLGQVFERRHAEEVKHPVDQHQPVLEFDFFNRRGRRETPSFSPFCAHRLFTILLIPSFNRDTLKFINSPIFLPLSFK